jgi:aminobenzoyl-glutamate utilization protein B
MFGTASVAAGVRVKKANDRKQMERTIKVYGCPAEEGGSGKVYINKSGLFKMLMSFYTGIQEIVIA